MGCGQPEERVGNMETVIVRDRKGQRKFINFRKEIYRSHPGYVDNNLFMIKELFSEKTCFVNNKEIYVIYIEEADEILCQGMVVYAKELSEHIQLCFFESRNSGTTPAVTKNACDASSVSPVGTSA